MQDAGAENLEWYIANQPELVRIYNGMHIVIVEKQVVGTFNNKLEAIRWMLDKFHGRSPIVILCEPGTRQYLIELSR